MTKVNSVVRLIPNENISDEEVQYCVQMLIPGKESRWRNVGHAFLRDGHEKWIPRDDYAALMPTIGLAPGGSMTGGDDEAAPFIFARYKIHLYLRKIASGEYSQHQVVPHNFATPGIDADEPYFL